MAQNKRKDSPQRYKQNLDDQRDKPTRIHDGSDAAHAAVKNSTKHFYLGMGTHTGLREKTLAGTLHVCR